MYSQNHGKFKRLQTMQDLALTCKCPICKDVYNSLTLASSSTCPHLGHDIIAYYESTESDVMELRQEIAHLQEHIKFLNKEIQDLHSDLRASHNQLRDIYMSGSQ